MCDRLRDPRSVEAWLASSDVTQEQVDRDANIFFVKLHLLDPAAVLPAFHNLVKGIGLSL